jgi:arylformamidase
VLDWRALSDATREREYSPSSCFGGNYQPYIAAYRTQSQAAHARCLKMGGDWRQLRYGKQPAQQLELYLPGTTARADSGRCGPGLLVYIHGGYWQELSAKDSLFAADECLARGHAFATIDYTLAPKTSLAEIIAECRAAIAFLREHAAEFGFDASRMVIAGSSAGAHLAAMVAADRSQPAISAAILVSGIFDLEPLVGTTINNALGLDLQSARSHSPVTLPLAGFPTTVICWGEIETSEFKAQSRIFAQSLNLAGVSVESFEIAQRNHFDVILELTDPATRLGLRTLSLLDSYLTPTSF